MRGSASAIRVRGVPGSMIVIGAQRCGVVVAKLLGSCRIHSVIEAVVGRHVVVVVVIVVAVGRRAWRDLLVSPSPGAQWRITQVGDG